MKNILSLFFRLFLLPLRLPLDILFSRKFSDRVIFYSIQPTDTSFHTRTTLQSTVTQTDDSLSAVTFLANGGGFSGRAGRFLIETGGSGGGTLKNENGYQLAAGSGQGGVNLGFVLKGGSGLRIYPLVGIGGQGGGFSVKDETGKALVNSGLADFIYNAGLGIDFKIGWRVGFIFGVRIGFDAPLNTGQHIPFTRYIVGFGWFD